MPGDGAGFMVVERPEHAWRRGARVLATIDAVAGGLEQATVLSDLPNTAQALTSAVDDALRSASLSAERLGMVWSDLNGESYKAREWAYCAVRLGMRDETRLMHPADCHGDLGAAADVHLLGCAILSHATGWSAGRPALVFAGSDEGLRAATVVGAAAAPTGLPQVSDGRPRIFSPDEVLPAAPEEPEDFSLSNDPPATWFHWSRWRAWRDDLASLYYQRRAMLHDESLPWPRLAEPEQRLLNVLDAVRAAGAEAAAFQAQGLLSDEEGVCHGAALLLGTMPSPAHLDWIEQGLLRADAACARAIRDALVHAPGSPRLDELLRRWVAAPVARLRAVGLHVGARRRTALPMPSLSETDCLDGALAQAFAEAAWRYGWIDAVAVLVRLLGHASDIVRHEALLSLGCLVPDAAQRFCRTSLARDAEFLGGITQLLAMGGQAGDAQALARLAVDTLGRPAILSLGILGDTSLVPLLDRMQSMDDPEVAGAAEEALRIIFGPVRGEAGAGVRWRRGRPFSAHACLGELADAHAPLRHRRRAHVEWSRWQPGLNVYEADAFVAVQREVLPDVFQTASPHGRAG